MNEAMVGKQERGGTFGGRAVGLATPESPEYQTGPTGVRDSITGAEDALAGALAAARQLAERLAPALLSARDNPSTKDPGRPIRVESSKLSTRIESLTDGIDEARKILVDILGRVDV